MGAVIYSLNIWQYWYTSNEYLSYCACVQDFNSWLDSDSAEQSCPMVWESQKPLSPVGLSVHHLMTMQAFRPDRLLAASAQFVGQAMGAQFLHSAEAVMNLASIVEYEIKAQTPILMCSVPGYDASSRVDDLAAELSKQITSIAIGTLASKLWVLHCCLSQMHVFESITVNILSLCRLVNKDILVQLQNIIHKTNLSFEKYYNLNIQNCVNKPVCFYLPGSVEGFNQATKAINSATKSGRWVMLKNVHLAPQWLIQLEKKLHSLTPHANFRLFLTMEINPKLPVNLLRAGRVFVFEPSAGVKANLQRTFATVPTTRMNKVRVSVTDLLQEPSAPKTLM